MEIKELRPKQGTAFPSLYKMALLERAERGKTSLWRYLCVDEKYVYVLRVDSKSAPKNSREPERWERTKFAALFGKTIFNIEEIVCPKWMLEARPDTHESSRIAVKCNQIAFLLDTGDELITNSQRRAELIKVAAKSFKTSRQEIRKLLTRHFYYGGHKFALMNLHAFKGAPGIDRIGITMTKMGRPNDSVMLDRKTPYLGLNMTKYYLRKWKSFVHECASLGTKYVTEMYELFLLKLGGYNKNLDGKIVFYRTDAKRLPERGLFLRHGAKIFKKWDLKRTQLGGLEWRRNHAAQLGYAQDLCGEGVDIYDMDGTIFNIELLFGAKKGPTHMGKPLVLFAVDRASRAIVGWFVWPGTEHSLGYKHCLFNAFTPKEERLITYGAAHLKGFVYGACDQICIDRGPGIAIGFQTAVTEEIHINTMLTRPRDPQGKGCVENVNRILQQKLADLPGASYGTDDVADQARQARAEKEACLTYDDFVSLLLHAISDYNLYTPVPELLSEDMLKAGIEPNPKAIFLWNRALRRGDAAIEWAESTLYKNLLNSHKKKVVEGVVNFKSEQYTSPELARYFETENSGPSNRQAAPVIKILELQETVNQIIWERDDGSLGMLERMGMHSSPDRAIHAFGIKIKNHRLRVQRCNQANKGTLTAKKAKVVKEANKLSKVPFDKTEKKENRAEATAVVKEQLSTQGLEILGLQEKGDEFVDSPITETNVWFGFRKNYDEEDEVDVHAFLKRISEGGHAKNVA